MRRQTWVRVGSSRGERVIRAILSAFALFLGVFLIVQFVAGSQPVGWGHFVWPAIYLFVGWRFFVMGVAVSAWGVRINNPVLAYWYPWKRIDRFELDPTGEMFGGARPRSRS